MASDDSEAINFKSRLIDIFSRILTIKSSRKTEHWQQRDQYQICQLRRIRSTCECAQTRWERERLWPNVYIILRSISPWYTALKLLSSLQWSLETWECASYAARRIISRIVSGQRDLHASRKVYATISALFATYLCTIHEKRRIGGVRLGDVMRNGIRSLD